MLLIGAITAAGEHCIVDADHIAFYVDTGNNGMTRLITPSGNEFIVKEPFQSFAKRVVDAARERDEMEMETDEPESGDDQRKNDH